MKSTSFPYLQETTVPPWGPFLILDLFPRLSECESRVKKLFNKKLGGKFFPLGRFHMLRLVFPRSGLSILEVMNLSTSTVLY